MKPKSFTILAVDDSEDDRLLITQALRQNGVTCPIQWAVSGEEAITYLKGEGKFSDRSRFAYPSFVMTDLKMAPGDGFTVLEHLQNNPERAVIPTVLLSASTDPDDIKRAYTLGAGAYIVKPSNFASTRECLKAVYDYWMWCEVPATDATGKRLPTEGRGKLGERFIHQHNDELT